MAGVLTLLVVARALGPAALGVLALVETYVRLADRLLRLEPWQAFIKYGIGALEAEDKDRFRRLVKLSMAIDVAGGCLAGVVAIALAHLIAPWIGLTNPEAPRLLIFLSLGLFFSLRPTAIGVLRSFDRFDILAKADMFSALVRLVLSVLAWASGLGLFGFLAILLVQSLLDGLLAFSLSMRELKRRGYHGVLNSHARGALSENPGFLSFLWNSNFNVMLRQLSNRLDIVLLGGLVDVTAVGYYQIGKRVMNSAIKLVGPFRQAIYPEMARLWGNARYQSFVKVIVTICLSVLAAGLLLALPAMANMDRLIALVFGAEFAEAAPVMNILLVSAIIFTSGVALNPALLSMSQDRKLVRITMLATLAYLGSFVPLVWLFGVEGAASSNLMFNIVWTIGCGLVVRRHLKQVRLEEASPD